MSQMLVKQVINAEIFRFRSLLKFASGAKMKNVGTQFLNILFYLRYIQNIITGLMNLETLTWDSNLCEHFGVPMNILPKIRSCSEVFGTLTRSRLKGLPISGCIGDQQAALIGQNCWRPGQGKY